MAVATITDGLWELLQPLLPATPRRFRYPGRRRLDDRRVLNGILYVLATGIAWDQLPQQLGFGSGMTCWRRLRDWNHAGVWTQLHQLLLAELRRADQLDWSRAVIDAAHLRALKGGRQPAQVRSIGHERAAKHHLICDARAIPLAVSLTGGNAHDLTQLLALVDQIPAVRGKRGRPRPRPMVLVADRGYDFDRYRRALRARGIHP
jgi:transposase